MIAHTNRAERETARPEATVPPASGALPERFRSLFTLSNKHKIHAALLILVVALTVYASQNGPERGHTGAPGDIGDCTACHDDHLVNVGAGRVIIGGTPAVYQPSQPYTLSVQVQDSSSSRRRWGFQLTAIDSIGNRSGTLTPLGSDTQIATDGSPIGDRQYIEHSPLGTFPGTPGGHTWQFRWTAPSTDTGAVRFFAAGNAANNDGTNREDFIYTATASSDSPSTVVSVNLLTRPDNLTLSVGSTYTFMWDVTNKSSVNGYDLRYSTDDGATFPLDNQLLGTTDPSVTSYEWTVPNKPTTSARIRLQVSTVTGNAVEVRSGRFTIGGMASPSPKIFSALVNGKKLFVSGENFQMGAVVELNGEAQVTANDDDFSHLLRCKKAGRKITPGSPVTLTVLNPDGTRSEPFIFTAPVE